MLLKYFLSATRSAIPVILILLPGTVSSQVNNLQENTSYKKRNDFQYISYKPEKAKDGKDGKDRIFVIQIIKGGKSGKAGKDGKNGPDLTVHVSLFPINDSSILQVRVVKTNNPVATDTFYVNPRFGQLKIASDGGEGGSGGRGEEDGGSDGSNGKGGNGGKIDVIFTQATLNYVKCSCLIFSNMAGAGGYLDGQAEFVAANGRDGAHVYYKDENGKILWVQ